MLQILIVTVLSVILTGVILILATDIFASATEGLFGTGLDLQIGQDVEANTEESGHPADDANDNSDSTFWEAAQA